MHSTTRGTGSIGVLVALFAVSWLDVIGFGKTVYTCRHAVHVQIEKLAFILLQVIFIFIMRDKQYGIG